MAIWKIKERNDLVRANEVRGSRGFFMGGTTPSAVSDIYQLDITSTGNATDFGGNLQSEQGGSGKGCNAGSAVRIIYGGGSTAPTGGNESSTQISHFTPIHSGNASDFGNLTNRRSSQISLSNNTRVLFGGGYDYAGAPAGSGTRKDIIDFITIQSLGNAVDFGNLQQAKLNMASVASTTRGVWAGGHIGSTINQIDFVTIASAGNAADFGDLSAVSESFAGSGNNIKGIVGGGNQGPYAGMDVITIASTGGGSDFGDLTTARRDLGSTSNQIRQVFGGGAAPGISNVIDFLQIASLGNASDFGDLAAANRGNSGSSVSHNGLELGLPQRPSVTYVSGSGRGFTLGGYTGSDKRNDIKLTHIPTKGNSSDFGDLLAAAYGGASFGSLTRGFFAGDVTEGNVIESFEYATQGNSADFGNLTVGRQGPAGLSNTTRGVIAGGEDGDISSPARANTIDYITMATTGNATDFGDLVLARAYAGATGNATRGIFTGGDIHPSYKNEIDYITIASTGNATDFGDLTQVRNLNASVSNATRGVCGGGNKGSSPNSSNEIDYVTIASTGDATDFGDLTVARWSLGGMSNSTRGAFAGGAVPGDKDEIDFITIASTGDAADFGDLVAAAQYVSCCADSHGGLLG